MIPGDDTTTRKTTVTALDRRRAMDQPVVRVLIPDFLDAVAAADKAVAEADVAYKTALEALAEARGPEPVDGDEDAAAEDADGAEPEEDAAPVASAEAIAVLSGDVAAGKRALAAARKKRKGLDEVFLPKLRAARDAVKDVEKDGPERVVLEVLDTDLSGRLDSAAAGRRRELVAAFRRWAEKYAVSLTDLEAESGAATDELGTWLKELGYAH